MTFEKEKGRGHKCVSVGVFIENKEAWEKICVSANTGGLYNGRLSSGYICIHSFWQTSAFLGPIIIQTLHPPSCSSPKGDRQVLKPCGLSYKHIGTYERTQGWICSIIIPCLSKVMIYDGKSLKRAICWNICLCGSVCRIQGFSTWAAKLWSCLTGFTQSVRSAVVKRYFWLKPIFKC